MARRQAASTYANLAASPMLAVQSGHRSGGGCGSPAGRMHPPLPGQTPAGRWPGWPPRLADRAGGRMITGPDPGRQAYPLGLCRPCRGPLPGRLGCRWLVRFGRRWTGGQRSGRLEAKEVRHRVPPDWIFGLRGSGGWQWLLRDLAHGLATLPCWDGQHMAQAASHVAGSPSDRRRPPVTGAPTTPLPARRQKADPCPHCRLIPDAAA